MQIEGLLTWEVVYNSSDVINLFNMVKSLTHQTMDQNYHPLSMYLVNKSVYGLQQGPHITNAQLVNKLKAIVDVVK